MENVKMKIYVDSSNLLVVTSVKNYVSGDYINDATVEVTILDDNNQEVSGETWPKAVGPLGVSGTYRCTLPYDLDINDDEAYTAKVFVDGGEGLRRTWYRPLVGDIHS
jgi:hypothetical protein